MTCSKNFEITNGQFLETVMLEKDYSIKDSSLHLGINIMLFHRKYFKFKNLKVTNSLLGMSY